MPVTQKPSQYFGHRNFTRKYLLAFMTKMNDIFIERYKGDGTVHKYIRVPLQFAQASVQYKASTSQQTIKTFNDLKIEIENVLPRMAVSLTGLDINTAKQLNKHTRFKGAAAENQVETMPSPVPYTISLEVTAIAKSMDDIFQIVEQVIPRFRPSQNINVKNITGYDSDSLAITLNSLSFDVPEELSMFEKRMVTATFDFVMDANYYAIKINKGIIKTIQTDVGLKTDDSFTKFNRFVLTGENIETPEIFDLKVEVLREV